MCLQAGIAARSPNQHLGNWSFHAGPNFCDLIGPCPHAEQAFSVERSLPHGHVAAVFLCMLAYYVEWHMRARQGQRREQDGRRRAAAVQLQDTRQDPATLAYNVTHTALNPEAMIVITTRATPLQAKAFAGSA
jgi:hypothetical protein